MTDKKTIRRFALIYSALYFILFLIFYLPNYVPACNEFVEFSFKTPYLIIRGVLEKLFQFFIPMSAAVLLLVLSSYNTKGYLLKSAIFLSLPTAVYSLPYCYLYALSLGFDSIEGTGISLAFTVCGVALQWCHSVLLYLLASFITGKKEKEGAFALCEADECTADLTRSYKRFDIKWAFDFSKALPLGIIVISLGELLYNLILEIINTVSYFIEADGIYDSMDILDIVGIYLFMLVTMILCHTVSCLVAQKIAKDKEDAEI